MIVLDKSLLFVAAEFVKVPRMKVVDLGLFVLAEKIGISIRFRSTGNELPLSTEDLQDCHTGVLTFCTTLQAPVMNLPQARDASFLLCYMWWWQWLVYHQTHWSCDSHRHHLFTHRISGTRKGNDKMHMVQRIRSGTCLKDACIPYLLQIF